MHHTIEGIRYSKFSDRGRMAHIAQIIEESCSRIGLWTMLGAASVAWLPLLVVATTKMYA